MTGNQSVQPGILDSMKCRLSHLPAALALMLALGVANFLVYRTVQFLVVFAVT